MNSDPVISLLLVDDHPVVRDGLSRIRELEPRIEIVGEAASAATAIEEARRLKPSVILMDIRLPDGDGIQACREIKSFLPEVHVLFLTSFADNRLVLAAIEAGAGGYLLKESDTRRIVDAIHLILKGGTVFDPIAAQGLTGESGHNATPNPLRELAPQERRVLAEVARGRTDKEVGTTLGLSAKTARNYLDRIFTKLNVHTRTEAALLYTRLKDQSVDRD
ncbi:MAG: response regulator transcription factor [Verrucomicrobia bacterium]|nr:response regulator transcription factor [Verrucomicrobiota bacterium]